MKGVVLGTGRWVHQKGFDVLIDAFKIVRSHRLVQLVILGEGEERELLLRHAGELGVSADVDFPRFVDNPFAYMVRAGVFMLSSRWEGLPNVLIQAFTCGCPCVSTNCPSGPADILTSGRYGELAPVDDATALAEAIEHTLDGNVDREFLRVRSRCYDAESLIDEWRSVILGTGMSRNIAL